MAKLGKWSIRFSHPSIPCWNGDLKCRDGLKLRRTLATLPLVVPERVRSGLRVLYREEGSEREYDLE